MNVHSYGKYRMDHEKAPEIRDLKKRPLYLAQKSVVPDDIDLAKSVTRSQHDLKHDQPNDEVQNPSYNFFEKEFQSKLMKNSTSS